jgi:hypothetical protein
MYFVSYLQVLTKSTKTTKLYHNTVPRINITKKTYRKYY